MAVTGADRWYLAILELGISKKFHTFVIERDEAEIEALFNAEREFWEENVLAAVAPSPEGSDKTDDYIKAAHPVADEKAEPVGLYGRENDLADYLTLKAQAKTLDKQITAFEQKFKLALGDAPKGLAQGYTVSFVNATRAGGVDAVKLREAFPTAYEACRKPDTIYRRFAVKEEK